MGYVVSVLLQSRAVNVDLQTDATLQVDISDALSERDKVKFTVHTKVRERHTEQSAAQMLMFAFCCESSPPLVQSLSETEHVSGDGEAEALVSITADR